jgi:hypothetical protein
MSLASNAARLRSLERRMAEASKRLQAPKTVIVIGDSPVPEKLPPGSTVLRISRG